MFDWWFYTHGPVRLGTTGLRDTEQGESESLGVSCTCEVDMRDASCRPVRSDEDTLTGAPRCRRMLTFRSRSIPET